MRTDVIFGIQHFFAVIEQVNRGLSKATAKIHMEMKALDRQLLRKHRMHKPGFSGHNGEELLL